MTWLEPVPFAALLKRWRSAAGLTQEELAQRACVSARAVSALERGVNLRPHKETVRLLADALALTGDERITFEVAARWPGHHDLATTGGEHLPPWQRLHAGPLVGRAAEISLIEGHVRGEGPPVLLFAGEPGIGKSRLLKEAGDRAGESGLTVLYGGSQRSSGQEPYSPLVGALARYVERRTPARVRAAVRGCEQLERLLPELSGLGGTPPPQRDAAPEQDRRLLFSAVQRFLGNVAGPGGTLLLLDDLQWAGSDALELIASLASRADEVPLRLVGAYRHTEVDPAEPLAITLGDLAQRDLARQVVLGPLTETEAAELLAGLMESDNAIEGDVVRHIVARAEGVPFFLISSVQAVRAGALSEVVPWTVRESIRQRAGALTRGAREVLDIAALTGRVVPRSLLLAVAEQPDERVVAALEEMCRARLLLEKGRRAYRFAHDVIQEVVEEDLGTARRAILHRKIAEALQQAAGPERRAADLAWHFLQADDPERALPYALQAGDQAHAAFAHREAERHFRSALELAGELGDEAHEAVALEKLGRALSALARYDESLDVLNRASETYTSRHDLQSLGRVTAAIARVHALRGSPDQGVRHLELVLPRFAEQDASQELAGLYTALAHLHFVSGRYRQQLEAAERAVDLAERLHDRSARAEAEVWRGVALLGVMRVDEGVQALERAIPRAEDVGDLASVSRALNSLASIYEERGELEREGQYLERALALAERMGDPVRVVFLTFRRGWHAYTMGSWDQARTHLEAAASLDRRIGTSWASAYPSLGLGALELSQGNSQEALRHLQLCLCVAERNNDLRALVGAQTLLAERDLLEGQVEAAEDRVEQILAHPRGEEQELARTLTVQARVYLEKGDDARAEAALTAGIERAAAEENSLALVDLLTLKGRLAARHQSWSEAEPALDRALSLAQSLRNPYAEARVLYERGVLHTLAGQPRRAHQHLVRALAIFERLGARPYIHRAKQALAETAKTHGAR